MTNFHYPLSRAKYDPNALDPINAYITEEYIQRQYKLYLSSHFARDERGKMHRTYRLHAVEPHTIDMALAYDIKCPNCRKNNLKQIGRCLNSYDLGLYKCPVCDKD